MVTVDDGTSQICCWKIELFFSVVREAAGLMFKHVNDFTSFLKQA